jgi:hypothetical protein
MAAAGFTEYDLYAGKAAPEAVSDVVAHIAPFIPDARPEGKYLRSCAAAARMYQAQLRKVGWNPFSARLAAPPLFFPLRVLWAGR